MTAIKPIAGSEPAALRPREGVCAPLRDLIAGEAPKIAAVADERAREVRDLPVPAEAAESVAIDFTTGQSWPCRMYFFRPTIDLDADGRLIDCGLYFDDTRFDALILVDLELEPELLRRNVAYRLAEAITLKMLDVGGGDRPHRWLPDDELGAFVENRTAFRRVRAEDLPGDAPGITHEAQIAAQIEWVGRRAGDELRARKDGSRAKT